MADIEKKYFLVIPFSARENNFSLYMRALDWRYSLKLNGKLNKLPEILMFRRDDETADDYTGYDDVKFALPTPDSSQEITLYLLADGIGDNEFVGNTNFLLHDTEDFYLPIQLVAKRLQSMGLSPELAAKTKLKLYVCGDVKDDSTLHLALKLGQVLGINYQNMPIDYYTTLVFCPDALSGTKKAVVKIELPDQALELDGELKKFKNIVYQEHGKPKDFKHTLLVSDTLAHAKEPSSHEASQSMNLNQAILPKDLPMVIFDSKTSSLGNAIITFFNPKQGSINTQLSGDNKTAPSLPDFTRLRT